MKATVYKNSTGYNKCNVLKRGQCRRKAVWMIMCGDGKPYLSRLKYTCCSAHLPQACRYIIEEEQAPTLIKDEETFVEEEFKL